MYPPTEHGREAYTPLYTHREAYPGYTPLYTHREAYPGIRLPRASLWRLIPVMRLSGAPYGVIPSYEALGSLFTVLNPVRRLSGAS